MGTLFADSLTVPAYVYLFQRFGTLNILEPKANLLNRILYTGTVAGLFMGNDADHWQER